MRLSSLFLYVAFLFGFLSAVDVVEYVVTSLFTNCSFVQSFTGLTYENIEKSRLMPEKSKINVILVVSKSVKIHIPLDQIHTIIPYYDAYLPTEILIHGFNQIPSNKYFNLLIDALLDRGGRNIIYIDASNIISGSYIYSTSAVKFIGEMIGMELASNENVLNISNTHLIGFSLGAHIAGFVGKTYQSMTGNTLPWITGLDPAGPCFFANNESERLSKTDADFVDVMHTNMGAWGIITDLGDVDFYPNSGDFQPGCIHPNCYHDRALEFYAESVLFPENFMAVLCNKWWDFRFGVCSSNDKVIMGYYTPKKSQGLYFLRTNSDSLYGLKDKGTKSSDWIIDTFKFLFGK